VDSGSACQRIWSSSSARERLLQGVHTEQKDEDEGRDSSCVKARKRKQNSTRVSDANLPQLCRESVANLLQLCRNFAANLLQIYCKSATSLLQF
jgi:hypothetical protein